MHRAGALIVALGILLGCGNPATIGGRSTQIAATDFEFAPAMDTVAPNQSIMFLFPSTDTARHNVRWVTPPPTYAIGDSSGSRGPGGTPYSVYITLPAGRDTATYKYYCTFHGSPDGTGMAGQIFVTTH